MHLSKQIGLLPSRPVSSDARYIDMNYSAHHVRYIGAVLLLFIGITQIEARTLIASQHKLSRFRGVISVRSTSVRCSSARVTGFYAS